jgi:ACT domain-containing protein
MNKSEQLKKEQLLEAMVNTLGIVSTACLNVGVSRTTYYKYYNEDEQFKGQVDDISNIAIDFAESKLFDLIKEGNIAAVIFYLKTKGKKRGYIEKQEIEIDGNFNLTVEFISPEEKIKTPQTINKDKMKTLKQ